MKKMKKIISLLLVVAMTSGLFGGFSVNAAEETNLALNKSATASSIANNCGPEIAVDGVKDQPNQWNSADMKSGTVADTAEQTHQWLQVDLGESGAKISQIKLWYNKRVWPMVYRIETTDTPAATDSWETVVSVDRPSRANSDGDGQVQNGTGQNIANNTENTDTITTTSVPALEMTELGRYVRIYVEKVNAQAPGNNVNLREIEIFGTFDGEPEVTVIGSEFENVVANDGTVSEWNIGARDVVLLVEENGVRQNKTVTVEDHSASYPTEWFPTVANPNAKPEVIPTIQEWYGYEGNFRLTENSAIVINDAADVGLAKIAANMQADLTEITGITPSIITFAEGETVVDADDIYIESLTDADAYDVGKEGYLMVTNDNGIQIYAPTYTGCIYGTITVEQILWMDDAHVNVPKGIMRDYPAYEVRGLKLDIARTPYRYQQLEDYAKIMLWYKMNEYDLHVNDNDNANISNATVESHSGFHRLKSTTFPSLVSETRHVGFPEELVNADYYNNNTDYQGNPSYDKAQWRALQQLTEDYGMYMITEIDLPGHSLLYNKYADKNPDNIDWLAGGIKYTGNELNTAGGIELMDLTGANKDRALQFAKALWNEYTSGSEPTIYGDIVHVGADEYWVHNTATHNAFAGFVDAMRAEIQNNLGADTKIRMWGAGAKSFSTATTVLGKTPAELAKDYQLDIWSTAYDNARARAEEGYQIVNCRDAYMYGNPGRTLRDLPNAEYLFNDWNPTIFGANDPMMGEPNLMGAKAVIWGDQSHEGMTEKDVHQRVLQAIAITSEKTWNGTDEDDTFAEWEIRKSHLAEGPGTEIAMTIESESSLVLDYNFANISTDGTKVYDASGNGYDATVTGGTVTDGWMTFDGNTLVRTPLKTLSYPYTVSFDMKLSAADGAANTKESSLFSGYDGRIQVAGFNGKMSADVNYFTRDFGYTVPTNGSEVEVTLVGTFQGTKVYVNGELVTFLSQKEDQDGLPSPVSTMYSSVLLPLEKIGQDFNGQLANIKVYNKAFSAEEVAAAYAGTDDGKVNVAQNTHAGSSSYRSGAVQDDSVQRTSVSMKTIDGDAFVVKADTTEGPETTTSDIYSYWRGDHVDSALTIDLGEERKISEIGIQWRYGGKGKDMQILTSLDGENWTVSKEVTGNADFFQTITLDAVTMARFVKLQCIASNNSTNESEMKYLIQEFMVYEVVDKSAMNTVLAEAETVVAENGIGFETTNEVHQELFDAVVYARALQGSPLATIEEVEAATAAVTTAMEALDEEILPEESVTLYYYISTNRVWEYDNQKATNRNTGEAITREITAQEAAGEEGIEIRPKDETQEGLAFVYGEWKNAEWKSDTELVVPTVYWKTTKLAQEDWQTKTDEDSDDNQGGIKDQSLLGTDFTHIRYYENAWQVKQTSDGAWVNLNSDEQIVSYYLQQTETTKEVTTYVKDWAFVPNSEYRGISNAGKRSQKALSFAVVYPDGQISPSGEGIYQNSTLIYWDRLPTLGFIRIEENIQGYKVKKITYTLGQRGTHDELEGNQVDNVWTVDDTIVWNTLEETNWFDEYTVWTPQSGTEPIIDGRDLDTIEGAEAKAGEGAPPIYPGDPTYTHGGEQTGYNGTWGKNDAVLILIYLEVQGDLNIKYVDDSTGTEFYQWQISTNNPESTFNNVVETIDGKLHLKEDASIENAAGVQETIETDLTKMSQLEERYKSGLYEYKYVELADDGKTLIIHYNYDLERPVDFVVDFGLPVIANLSNLYLGQNITNIEIVAEPVYGDASVSGTSITYTPNEVLKGVDAISATVTFDGGTSETRIIRFIPATTVYYEEGFVETFTGEWAGGSKGTVAQQATIPGATADFNDRAIRAFNYGYDSAYDSADGVINHVRNATLDANSQESGSLSAAKAGDGDYNSRWSSASVSGAVSDSQLVESETEYLKATFAETKEIKQINITFHDRKQNPVHSNTAQFSIKYVDAGGNENAVVVDYPVDALGAGYETKVAIVLDEAIVAKELILYDFVTKVGTTQWNSVGITELEAYSEEIVAGPSNGTEAVSVAQNDMATFEFKGTGVEIYTNNTESTGNVLVYLSEKVLNPETRENGYNLKGMYFVDTKMKDGDTPGTQNQNVTAYNVPIVDIRGLEYGEYQIKMLHIVPSNEDVKPIKLDGFRVIETLETHDAYEKDGEQSPEFVELRDAALLANLSNNVYENDRIYADELANGIMSQVYAYGTDKNYQAIVLDHKLEGVNLVRNATLSANSQETSGFSAANVGDGSYNSRWSSASVSGALSGYELIESETEYLKATFDEVKEIRQINVSFYERNQKPIHSNTAQFSIEYVDADGRKNYVVEDYVVEASGEGYVTKVSIVLDEPIMAKELILSEFVTKAGTTQWNSIGITELEAYSISTIMDYVDNGPKNEIYLKPGQALVFKVNAKDAQIGLKALDAMTSYTVLKGSTAILESQNFGNSTDMYYELNPEGAEATYTITNNGGSILAVTLLKLFEKEEVTDLTAFDIQPALVSMGYTLRDAQEEPETTPVTEVFSDVAANEWYTEAVQYVYDKGIMSGSNGAFNPAKNMTRAQLVMTLYNLEDSPKATDRSACDKFTDVKSGEWYTDAVCWAYSNGITNGNSANTFGVNVSLTREQLVTFLYNYASKKGLDTNATGDLSNLLNADKAAAYAVKPFEWAVGKGIIGGINGSDLAPKATATRAQLAVIVKSFCEVYDL